MIGDLRTQLLLSASSKFARRKASSSSSASWTLWPAVDGDFGCRRVVRPDASGRCSRRHRAHLNVIVCNVQSSRGLQRRMLQKRLRSPRQPRQGLRVPGMSSVLKGFVPESSARAGREAAWRLVGGRSALPLHVLRCCNCRAEVVQLSHGRRESGSDLYESICRARVRADACLVVPCLRWRHVWRMRVEEAHQASSHTCR